MLTIAFQSMSCVLAALACITLTYSLESPGTSALMLEPQYETPPETRDENMLGRLMRVNRGYRKHDFTFGRNARNDAFQTSPLIRFGKRYVMDDTRSEVLARLLQQYFQEQKQRQ